MRQFDLMVKGARSLDLGSWEDQFDELRLAASDGSITAEQIANLIDYDYQTNQNGLAGATTLIAALLRDALPASPSPPQIGGGSSDVLSEFKAAVKTVRQGPRFAEGKSADWIEGHERGVARGLRIAESIIATIASPQIGGSPVLDDYKRIAKCAEVALGQSSLSQKNALKEISKIALIATLTTTPPSGGAWEMQEACARIADEWLAQFGNYKPEHVGGQIWANDAVKDIAAAIRALPPPASGSAGSGEAIVNTGERK